MLVKKKGATGVTLVQVWHRPVIWTNHEQQPLETTFNEIWIKIQKASQNKIFENVAC